MSDRYRSEPVAHDPSDPPGHLPGFAREEYEGGMRPGSRFRPCACCDILIANV